MVRKPQIDGSCRNHDPSKSDLSIPIDWNLGYDGGRPLPKVWPPSIVFPKHGLTYRSPDDYNSGVNSPGLIVSRG